MSPINPVNAGFTGTAVEPGRRTFSVPETMIVDPGKASMPLMLSALGEFGTAPIIEAINAASPESALFSGGVESTGWAPASSVGTGTWTAAERVGDGVTMLLGTTGGLLAAGGGELSCGGLLGAGTGAGFCVGAGAIGFTLLGEGAGTIGVGLGLFTGG